MIGWALRLLSKIIAASHYILGSLSLSVESRPVKVDPPDRRTVGGGEAGQVAPPLFYTKKGTLEGLRRSQSQNQRRSGARRSKVKVSGDSTRQAVEAVHFIHGREIIHSDLAARQFLVDDNGVDIRLRFRGILYTRVRGTGVRRHGAFPAAGRGAS